MTKTLLLLLLSLTGYAQQAAYFGQQQLTKPATNCIPSEVQQRVFKQLAAYRASARMSSLAADPVLFDWPLRQRPPLDYTYFGLSFFVDHDPSTGIRDYNGGSRTYDGHTGTDISPQPYQWDMMDNSRVEVIAAAPGTIVLRQDGNYDRRCQSDPSYVGNAIILQHADGSQTWYWHMKNGSVTQKAVGQTVQLGEYLGTVGSSGNSGGPHLHFEVRDANNTIIDPFAGPSNTTTANSRWLNQKPYWDSQIGRLMTHSAQPNPYPACSANPVDVTYEKRSFVSGDMVYFAHYGRDWQPGQTFNFKIIQPDGTVWANYNYTRPQDFQTFASTFYYFNQALPNPAQTGRWKYQVTTLGTTYETTFNVNTTSPYASTTAICSGGNVELVAMNGGQDFSYQWQLNGNAINGATGDRYTATQAGVYTVAATKNGATSVSDPLSITASGALATIKVGNWNDPAVWSCGRVPVSTDAVTVNHAVTMPGGYVGQALRVAYNAAGRIVFNANGQLKLAGN